MSAIATAVIGGAVVSAYASNRAAKKAAGAQSEAAQAGISAQERQLESIQKLLAPFVQAAAGGGGEFDEAAYLKANPDIAADPFWGANPELHFLENGRREGRQGFYTPQTQGSLQAQQALLGLSGQEAQRAAIGQIESSPGFQSLVRQGEAGILANASATGGLRGGNVQAALAQFRPALLSQAIESQFAKLGGLTSLGQNAAAGVGNAGLQTAQGTSALLQQAGAAQAGQALAQGQGIANIAGSIPQAYLAYRYANPTVDTTQSATGGGTFNGLRGTF